MNDDAELTGSFVKEENSFEQELINLINRKCMENASNTPDFILATFLKSCLDAFDVATQQRETWHGRDARPSRTRYGRNLDV